MPGSIRALRRQADPIRGGGRIPLTKRRTAGNPQYRRTGVDTLSAEEDAIASAVEDAFNTVSHETLLDAVERRDVDGYGRSVLAAFSEASAAIEAALLRGFISSGEATAREIGVELSRAYRRVGKAEAPSPSEVALRFRFNVTDPRATEWARAEAGRLITNMTASQRDMMRALVEQSFVEGRTMSTTASSIFRQLQTVTPGPTAREFADAIGSNLNGLTARYERAVMNRVADLGDDLAKRGVSGTRALEQMRKEGDKYATKLRRARSRTIARTERMVAHNQARLLTYQQAIDDGLMSREHSRKVWSTGPFDVCPICVSMSGTEAKVADPFTLPNGSQVQAPPAHPNCRCTLQSRTDTTLYDPPEALGTGVPGDPFRVGGRGLSQTGREMASQPLPAAPKPPSSPPVARPQPPTPSRGRTRSVDAQRAAAADHAERFGVTVEQILMSLDDVPILRRKARAEASRRAAEVHAQLDAPNFGSVAMPDPRDIPREARAYVDWYDNLHRSEKRRLRDMGWTRRGAAQSVDEMDEAYAVQFGLETRGLPGQALEEHWLRLTREHDLLNMARRGRRPGNLNRYGGSADYNALLPDLRSEGWDVNILMAGDEFETAAMIARRQADDVLDEAASLFGRAGRRPIHGPAPWRMSFQSWEDEVRDLESRLRFESVSEVDVARYEELVPSALDNGADYEELYATIIETARYADFDVADYATIPWM